MKKSLTQNETTELTPKQQARAQKDFAHFTDEFEKELRIREEGRKMKNELTIDAIDTLILNSLWDEDLPMIAHIKNETSFFVMLRSGEDFARLHREHRSTNYVLTMRKSGKRSCVAFDPESDPILTTPDMIINGIYRMISQMFKKSAA